MGADTKIQWTDHTFNPWIGCTRVSPGCVNCYAETQNVRWRGGSNWGPGAPRQVTSASNWLQPLKWNREAAAAGIRRRVFCASLADVFDDEAPFGARDWLWELIRSTPWLDWLLLTKRPENIAKYLPLSLSRENVWLGTTIEDQRRVYDRIGYLLANAARFHFLSLEPLLGCVDLGFAAQLPKKIDWAIIGGESGPRARPFHIDWARDLIAQCRKAGIAPFVKQLGANPYDRSPIAKFEGQPYPLALDKAHGGNPDEWPADLRVREFPNDQEIR